MKRRACVCAIALWGIGAPADPLATERVPDGPQDLGHLAPIGQGTLRFLGFAVYDARLWAAPGLVPRDYGRTALALELRYRRAFTAAAIAQRSIEEMRRVGVFDDTQARRWQAALQSALPDVKAGERLLGVHRPDQGAEFWRDARLTGRVDDAEFSRLFFGIWLAPQTSAPELRQSLLARAREGP